MGGYFLEHNNFIPADPLNTPPHIAPVVLHPVLRDAACRPAFLGSSQFWGVAVMGGARTDLLLAALARSQSVKSIRYKGPYYKLWLALFVVSFLVLGWLGTQPTDFLGRMGKTDVAVILARVFTLVLLRFLGHALA